ncbi:MAG: hypothetical protein DMG24_09070, partial [Acidobacteria bacterium]
GYAQGPGPRRSGSRCPGCPRDYILRKLEENQGNVSRTAEVLGLERSHLYRKMKSLGIAARGS